MAEPNVNSGKLLFAEAKRMTEEIEQIEEYVIKSLLQEASVITATLVGASHRYVRHLRYSTVFIDEAAQALEPACWIPISKADRVVLAGDHCQLPPTVKSMEAAKGGLEVTLFERLMKSQPHTATLLETQYRMHESIMGFSSAQFYNGRLEAHESVASRALSDESDYIAGTSLEFVDTAGCGYEEDIHSETSSTFNEGEAGIVIQHLDQLLSHLYVTYPDLTKKCPIGIISPYQAQVKLLREKVQGLAYWEEFKNQIQISTVDGFQGQEKAIIYISLVRSNLDGQIGFLKDTRRMNVALTRAQQKLVVVGDSATLGES